MKITLEELKEMIRRMENSGANNLEVQFIFPDCNEDPELVDFDAMDNDLYLDTLLRREY